jgi:hypothetical protein
MQSAVPIIARQLSCHVNLDVFSLLLWYNYLNWGRNSERLLYFDCLSCLQPLAAGLQLRVGLCWNSLSLVL